METKRHEYKLLPDHDFILVCHAQGGEVFADIFRDVWNSIPRHDTDQIIDFWETDVIHERPRFEFSNLWGSETISGQVRQNGREVRFRQSLFACFTKRAAKWVVAHELAHVYQKVIGRMPGGENEDENERNADEIAENWGFSKLCHLKARIYQHEHGLSWKEAWRRVRAD